MNEEEIIKRLTKPKKYTLIEILRKFKRDGIENYIITKPELVQGLLDLYNKEKEKNKSIVYNYECVVDKLEELEKIEKEHKEENGKLREKIKELEEKQIHRYNKECLNCGVNFIAKRIDTGYCKKCSHIVANRKYKQKNKEKVNAYAKIYMRKRRANKVEEDIKE